MSIRDTSPYHAHFSDLHIAGHNSAVDIAAHTIAGSLFLKLGSGRVVLNQLKFTSDSATHTVNVTTGMVSINLESTPSLQHFTVQQPYGAICLAGAQATKLNGTRDCPS